MFHNSFHLPADIDECVNILDACTCGDHAGCVAYCTNVDGNYECSCSEGFRLMKNDEFKCEDIDECLTDTYECMCPYELMEAGCTVECVNLDAFYVCLCSEGFVLEADGLTCMGRRM